MFATVATLIFVPAVFSLIHGMRKGSPAEPVRESELTPLHQ